ncbi:MAG: tRNA preQ1(34) S-adenosylmethionine ribosyltransferase-isomerase QueA [Sandaracinaceae bacterium]
MEASDLEYALPPELVAQHPPTEREGGRLLVLRRGDGTVDHRSVRDLPSLLRPALLVVNDTKVLPARLQGTKLESGGRVELLLVERVAFGTAGAGSARRETWRALGRSSKALRPGMALAFGALGARVVEVGARGELIAELDGGDRTVRERLDEQGHVPLPPYIRRPDEPTDRERYQTVYAAEEGSVAAPTAGLHLSEALLARLEALEHRLARVTLHVGPGTFRPVTTDRLEAHRMHEERYEVPARTRAAIAAAKGEGRPVVAVGTTVVRTLEAAADPSGLPRAGAGRTDLFLRPGSTFRVVDGLLTNFHLPRSTLLALVMAFGGVEQVREAYRAAVAGRYRFASYGDAMLVVDGRSLR